MFRRLTLENIIQVNYRLHYEILYSIRLWPARLITRYRTELNSAC